MIAVYVWRRTTPPNDLRITVWNGAPSPGEQWNLSLDLSLDQALELRTKLTEALEGITPKEKP